MSQQYRYDLELPAPGADDVVKRELHVNRDGVEEIQTVEGDLLATSVVVDENTHVSLFLVDFDEAGNASEPGPAAEFDVTDQVPPPAPGAPGVTGITAL